MGRLILYQAHENELAKRVDAAASELQLTPWEVLRNALEQARINLGKYLKRAYDALKEGRFLNTTIARAIDNWIASQCQWRPTLPKRFVVTT